MPNFGFALAQNANLPMARQGRFGDTLMAHLSPKEAAYLKAAGGSGTTNPKTGALEFFGDDPGQDPSPGDPNHGKGPSFGGVSDVGALGAGVDNAVSGFMDGAIVGAIKGTLGHIGEAAANQAEKMGLTVTRPGDPDHVSSANVSGSYRETNTNFADLMKQVPDVVGNPGAWFDPDAEADVTYNFGGQTKRVTGKDGMNFLRRRRLIQIYENMQGDDYLENAGTDRGNVWEGGRGVGDVTAEDREFLERLFEEPILVYGKQRAERGYRYDPVLDLNHEGPSTSPQTFLKHLPKILSNDRILSFEAEDYTPSEPEAPTSSLPPETNTGTPASGAPASGGTSITGHSESSTMSGGSFGDKLSGPAQTLAQYGRGNDTLVAHITEDEARKLKREGGSGTINPWTGFLEFMTKDEQQAAARAEGYTGEFGQGGYTAWKQEQLNQFKGADGNLRSDLAGGNLGDINAPGSLNKLRERQEGRDAGYQGTWGEGGYTRFLADYKDHDGDASTAFRADNASNVDRFGNNVGDERDKIRNLGFRGDWGSGQATAFLQDLAKTYGYGGPATADNVTRARSDWHNSNAETSRDASFADLISQIGQLFAGRFNNASTSGPTERGTAPLMPENTVIPANAVSQIVQAQAVARPRPTINPWTGAVQYLTGPTSSANSFAMAPRRGFGNIIRV